MDSRARPAGGGPCPGTEPAALWLITAAVVAGLLMTGFTAETHAGPGPAGSRVQAFGGRDGPGAPRRQAFSGAREQVLAGAGPSTRRTFPVPRRGGGVTLLSQAAQACREVAFHGVEVQAWWSQYGQGSSVLDVWHAPGSRPLARAVAAGSGWPAQTVHAVEPGQGGTQSLDGDGMLGMSQRLVALLTVNYRLTAAGPGWVAGRPAQVVAVYRPGGGLAARFWLDESTKLPLRRQMFDSHGRVISDVAFSELRLGAGAVTRLPGAAARPWGDALAWRQLVRLRAGGWVLPGPLPGHLVLLEARQELTATGPILDLDYSDGLSVVSVFVQRGHLPGEMTGWLPVVLGGHRVYADGADSHILAWSASGFVYTVVAAAPPQTLRQVIAALPHDDAPGLITRIDHGLHRLLAWLKP